MTLYAYTHLGKKVFSRIEYPDMTPISLDSLYRDNDPIYYLYQLPPGKSRGSFSLNHPKEMLIEEENLHLLQSCSGSFDLPDALAEKMASGQVKGVNTQYPKWQTHLNAVTPKRWRVNLLALGDVGGTLLLGLKLLGGGLIDHIGVYDRNPENLLRWEMEMNQVCHPFNHELPPIIVKEATDLFDGDLFVFCASKGVPPVGSDIKDVRMIQFEENAKILSTYAKMARDNSYTGLFAVVSDPVDHLCYAAFKSSNLNASQEWDYQGLFPEQIKGYGLGVMHARAVYHSQKQPHLQHYQKFGRAFGPHGEGLVIADSIKNYNQSHSLFLTQAAIQSNLAIRELGYKPYMAPALSSGAISLIRTMSHQWHYSANFIGGAYMGSNNRQRPSGIQLERLDLPLPLFARLSETYEKLRNFNER